MTEKISVHYKNSSKFHHSDIIIVKILVLLITTNTC